jgi:hypothetical protein
MAAGSPLPATSPKSAIGGGNDLEEVPAHLLRGFVDALDAEAEDGFDLLGKDDLLHLARGFEFTLKHRLQTAGPACAKNHDDGQGDGREDSRDSAQ